MVNDSSRCTLQPSISGPARIRAEMGPCWLALQKTSILSHWWANEEEQSINYAEWMWLQNQRPHILQGNYWNMEFCEERKVYVASRGNYTHVWGMLHMLRLILWGSAICDLCVCVLYMWEWIWWNLMKYAYACQTSIRRITLTRKAKKQGWCETIYSILFCMLFQ